MEVITIESEAFKIIQRDLVEIKSNHSKSESLKPFYTVKELCALFKISSRTCQEWRNRLIIGYVQVNGVIIFTKEDILEFLKKHHKPSFKAIK